jgi:hypothetical protein
MAYKVQFGDTIGDAVLNSTGVITNWELFLQENGFDSWTPDLIPGDSVIIPESSQTDLQAISALSLYRACNSSSKIIYGLIEEIFDKLLSTPPQPVPQIPVNIPDTNKYYRVRYGETITDIVLNATGNISNWEDILFENEFDWIPDLVAGSLIAIPQSVDNDLNALRALTRYPANNKSENDIYDQIDTIFELMNGSGDWILRTGFWDDSGHWYDTSFWID